MITALLGYHELNRLHYRLQSGMGEIGHGADLGQAPIRQMTTHLYELISTGLSMAHRRLRLATGMAQLGLLRPRVIQQQQVENHLLLLCLARCLN